MRISLSVDRLKGVLKYDPTTGDFTWIKILSKRHKVGDRAGCLDNRNYVIIQIDGVQYKAHRLAWLYMTGKWSNLYIDHIDNNPSNNKWSNLREATNNENQANSKNWATNKTGMKGVSILHRGDGYSFVTAHVMKDQIPYKKYFSLQKMPLDEALSQAKEWCVNKRAELHGEFVNHG